MRYRTLGRTGFTVSVIGFGAGPVPALMTGIDRETQRSVVERALAVGINWFDTAPGYGDGQSETNLGLALRQAGSLDGVHVATKVRLTVADLEDPETAVRRSLADSLQRLGLSRVTVLQLHNALTAVRGSVPASLTPADVLRPGGVLQALQCLRAEGLANHIGLTGTGDVAALLEVIESGAFATIQLPYNLLHRETEEIVQRCRERGVAVLAIRVFAGGALVGQPPSAHTLRTPYFPLALYEADSRQAAEMAAQLGSGQSLKEAALRFVLGSGVPEMALIGLSTVEQVEELARLSDLCQNA